MDAAREFDRGDRSRAQVACVEDDDIGEVFGTATDNRLIVDAVVVEPWGAHPSYAQGYYDRDNRFYLDWDPISRDEAATQAWLREWVYDLDGRGAYMDKLGPERKAALKPGTAPSGSVDYGDYR